MITAPQRVNVTETIVTEMFPLLPYIFFDSASAEIPSRYVQLTTTTRIGFDEKNLPSRTLETYYQALNIFGDRMMKDPKMRINLGGTTDPNELSQHKLSLAKARKGVPSRAVYPTITLKTSKEIPMWSNHPYVAQHLSNDRQDRLRQVSQRSRLLHDVKRSRRQQHIKT